MPSARCPNCNGAGWYDVEKERMCGRCVGTGKEMDGSKCLKCKGSGSEKYTIKEVCKNCHGSGKTSY